jgi:hypothetical protein
MTPADLTELRRGYTMLSESSLEQVYGDARAGCKLEKNGRLPRAEQIQVAASGRWGEGLTASKMTECRWLQPPVVGQFEFVEWKPDGHLRHSRLDWWSSTRTP